MTNASRFTWWELRSFARRRGRLMLAVFFPGAALACAFAYVLPDVYDASTTIVVERTEMASIYSGAARGPRIEERLRVAQTFLTSDTLIQRVALRLGLADDPRDAVSIEDAVDAIRGKLQVKVSGLDSFQLSFRGRNPETVMRVVNELAGEFIKETVSYSERVGQETTGLLQEEKASVEARLSEYEARIKAFRERTPHEAPEQLEVSLKAIDRLQARLDQVTRELREAQDKVPVLERQLAVTPPTSFSNETERATVTPLGRLQALHAALDSALAKYTDAHPEVERLRREIREASARLTAGSTPSAPGDAGGPAANLGPYPNPSHVALAASLDLARASIRRLEAERSETVAEIRKHQARLDLMPRRAQELAALTRDYEALKERHQVVLKKTLEAELSRNVERRQNDETFRVLDPATLPPRPAQPRRLTIALAGIVLAGALSIGAGWGTDRVLDSTFHSARAVEEALKLPVLAMVPAIASPGGRVKG